MDDEALGRRGIVSRLARAEGVDVVAECGNGQEAVDAVRRLRPDLLFLDVQMPGRDGFDVVRSLSEPERPHVIFVTAYDRHAVRAFDVHALDYLLKPIDDERFAETLRRAREAIEGERVGEIGRRVLAAVGDLRPGREPRPTPPRPSRFAVRDRGRVTFVAHRDVDWIEAEGDYVRLHCGGRSWLLRDTMASVEKQVPPGRFVRIHRSTIVQVDRIRELRPFDNGDAAVLLADGTELSASRTRREALTRLLRSR